MATIGEYALAGALLASVAVVLAALAYWRLEDAGALRAARWGMGVIGGLLCVSAGALLGAILGDDFTVRYVVEHSEKALPTGYKMAAFWASQGGGLLLWAWAMGVMGAIMAWRMRKKEDLEAGVSLAVMAAIIGFFVAVILFAGSNDSPANPLELVGRIGDLPRDVQELLRSRELVNADGTVRDGLGLNPALQSLAMVFHPPMLFLGYAGFAAPFALLMASLITGKDDGAWLKEARGWMVWSWVMLTIGIILGCWWAYTELGWGGYWAWDPVENASLLPWLTGTALLHSAVLQARRGLFKRWTAVLTVMSFLLCVFGTYITRSGIKSVHSFEASAIPVFFLWMMGTVAVGTSALVLARLRERRIAMLLPVSVVLCVLTPYILRWIESTRELSKPDIAAYWASVTTWGFLASVVLATIIMVASATVIIVRLCQRKSATELESLISREGFFLFGNLLLVAMALVTTVGTALPLLTEQWSQFCVKVLEVLPRLRSVLIFPGSPIETNPGFYNKVVLPMGLVLAALMATGPILGHGAGAAKRARLPLLVMVLAGLLATEICTLTTDTAFPFLTGPATDSSGVIYEWVILPLGLLFSVLVATGPMAVVAGVVTGVVIDFSKAMLARIEAGRENVAAAHVKVISGGLRHWGAQAAHLGLAAIVAGVLGSSLYKTEEEFKALEIGQARTQNGMTVTMRGVRRENRDTCMALVTTVDVTDATGKQYTLHPEMVYYNQKPEEPAAKVDAALSLRRDVYVHVVGMENAGKLWAVQVILNPLVNWIWIGGALLTLGGLICLVPQRAAAAGRGVP